MSQAEVLRPDQVDSLVAFLTTHANFNREVVYDDSDCYCHLAVTCDPQRGLRKITSGPRDNVIYADNPLEPAEALELVRAQMAKVNWPFPR